MTTNTAAYLHPHLCITRHTRSAPTLAFNYNIMAPLPLILGISCLLQGRAVMYIRYLQSILFDTACICTLASGGPSIVAHDGDYWGNQRIMTSLFTPESEPTP
ncbi:hypothetical protein BDV93DRAFT_341529 [Ceratobasidium sp. AG-I]|nr:hypothetical protein BDV93DRAFT_341529 [Ceratobasidium sp. AG-I]